MKILTLSILLSLTLLASCGGSKSGSGPNSASENEFDTPSSPIPSKIENLKNFEEWKKKKLKFCDLDNAFGVNKEVRSAKESIDINLLIASNNNSAIFRSGEDFVSISGFTEMTGLQSDETHGTELDARIERVGSLCKVMIDGKEVFKTTLAANLIVSNAWEERATYGNLSTEDAIKKSIEPTEDSIEILGQILRLNRLETKRYIKISPINNKIIYRISKNDPWNSLSTDLMGTYSIEVRTPSPLIADASGRYLNFNDTGNLDFNFNTQSGYMGGVELTGYTGTKPYSASEGYACLKKIDVNEVNHGELVKICGILDPGIRSLSFKNEEI